MSSHVTQIFISEDDDAPLAAKLAAAMGVVRRSFPGTAHRLWRGGELRAFIAARFGGDVLRAYDCLKPFAYKADLGRYCLIHELGGWYLDLPVRPMEPISIAPEVDAVLFRDLVGYPNSWAVTNAMFYARPGAPFLARAIDLVVENCRRGDRGMTTLSVSGPALFGRALGLAPERGTHIYGNLQWLTPERRKVNPAFVMEDGTLFAWAKQSDNGHGLAGFGARGTNSYEAMWLAEDVFGIF